MWVAQAEDGIEAMRIALRGAADGSPYDLLRTDLFRPHLSGEELGRRLKRREHTRSICLAVLTATGARGDPKRMNEAGFAGYLTRPVPPERLEELLQAILATRDLPEDERRREGLVTRYHIENDAVATHAVLVVDDSPVNLEITLHHLARLGIEADSVGDGAAAIQAVGQRGYGAVLMDLRLPDMNGAEAIRRIRPDGGGGEPAMLVLAAGATEEERRACEAAGIEALLTKPIERSTLRAALDEPGDLEALGRHAHAIGSGSRHFPGEQLSDRARRLEALADAGDLDTIREAFPDFESAWTTMREWLETAAAEA